MENTQQTEWKFISPTTSEVQLVQPERWWWAVVYDDGSELVQFDENGIFHQIGEVDQSRVHRFILGTPDGSKRMEIRVPDGAKLIHGYKMVGVIDLGGNTPHSQVKVYKFGYKVNGHTHLNYVMPDDKIIQATRELNAQELGF